MQYMKAYGVTPEDSEDLTKTNLGLPPYRQAEGEQKNTLHITLSTTMESAISLASSSSLGPIILQGPHQVAMKSITTSFSPASESLFLRSSESLMWIAILKLAEKMLKSKYTYVASRCISHIAGVAEGN